MLLVFGSLLLAKLERWLQLMLKWSPQERGKDPEATPSDCFSQLAVILQLKVNCFCGHAVFLFLLFLCSKNSHKNEVCKLRLQCLNLLGPSLFPQLVHVLNMTSAKILTYSVSDDETVADLQLKIEKDTSISAADQELLLEAGLALEPHGLATQCAIDYTVISNINTVYVTLAE